MRATEIFEAPIEDITHVGDWSKNSSYREQDRKLLNNPKAIQKITTQWQKTPVPFNVFLVNSPEANRHTEIGEVDLTWLIENMPKTYEEIKSQIKSDAVNILFTNNKGDKRVPMTGWIMAHRFGHAVSRRNWAIGRTQFYDFAEARKIIYEMISDILKNGYSIKVSNKVPNFETRSEERTLINFFSLIGTMRSAREHIIRSEFEFTLELLAQYMLTGRIKFNPLPKTAKSKSSYFYFILNEHDYEYYNQVLTDLAEQLEDIFSSLMHSCVGKILVM